MTRTQWQSYCKGIVGFKEYFLLASKHIGWTYTYKNLNVHVKSMNKEDAFYAAMDKFHERFGIFGVIEDDVLFNPIFNS